MTLANDPLAEEVYHLVLKFTAPEVIGLSGLSDGQTRIGIYFFLTSSIAQS